MIDAGTSSNKDTIFEYLENNDIKSIDYLILTHFDEDHIGSADKIIKNYDVHEVIEPDYIKDNKEYEDLKKQLDKKQITPAILSSNYSFTINNALFTIYPALKKDYGIDASNEFSLAISIKHEDNTFLLAGDCENDRLKELENQMDISHTLLKIPHHGEKDSYSEDFIKLVDPKYAVITTSSDQNASKKILNCLDDINCKTFLTYNGNVLVKSDGKNISVNQDAK